MLNARSNKRKSLVKTILVGALVILLIFIVHALAKLDLQVVLDVLKGAHLAPLLYSQLLLVLMMIARAVRWQLLFSVEQPTPPLNKMFASINICNLANNFLPARAGEVARVAFVAKDAALPMPEVLSSVFWDRLLDLVGAILMAIAIFSSMDLHQLPHWAESSIEKLFIAGGVLLMAALVLLFFGENLVSKWVHKAKTHSQHQTVQKVLGFIEKMVLALSKINRFKVLVLGTLATMAVWSIEWASVELLLQSLSIDIPWTSSLFILFLVMLSTGLPSAPGFVGAIQIGCLLAFELLHLSKDLGLAFAILFQITIFLPTTPFGLYYLAKSGFKLKDFRQARLG